MHVCTHVHTFGRPWVACSLACWPQRDQLTCLTHSSPPPSSEFPCGTVQTVTTAIDHEWSSSNTCMMWNTTPWPGTIIYIASPNGSEIKGNAVAMAMISWQGVTLIRIAPCQSCCRWSESQKQREPSFWTSHETRAASPVEWNTLDKVSSLRTWCDGSSSCL